MACIMPVYTARALEINNDLSKRIDMDRCLIDGTTSRSMCIKLMPCEYHPQFNSRCNYIVNGVKIRFFPCSGYIIAYGHSFTSSKRALVEFLNQYPLPHCDSIELKYDFITTVTSGV